MATLSFNPTNFRDQTTLIPYKPISNFTSFSQPTKISCTSTSHNISNSPTLKTSSNCKRRRFLVNSVSESSIEEAETIEDVIDDDPTAEMSFLDPGTEPENIIEWELDFCSRPILDIRGKKIWELVVCDNSLSLQYTKYFPNNVINSITLKNAIVAICDELGVPLPEKIRFFRSQLQTIITKACKELGIKPIPSKRCLSLLLWLEERYETIYTRHPGFQKGAKPLMVLDNPFPMELPENLFGDRWAFVQLPYSAWMNGLEVCSIEADTARACLLLSVGISTRYIYATYKKTPETTQETEAWEATKKACGGLHFLAIQEDLDSDDCVGFWLLLDLPPPPV
uniref:Uncharacterized protein n=1 Tax=Chenopodium quinoa TaxID=63459 RepID=A0A803LC05_CHEQI